jgi:cell division protein FtsB
MTFNGYKIPWALILAVLTFTFWLGGLSLSVNSMAQDQKEHEAEPAHVEAALATNTVQADVRHNREEIAEIKEKLNEIEQNMEEDKDEILEAIREHDTQ